MMRWKGKSDEMQTPDFSSTLETSAREKDFVGKTVKTNKLIKIETGKVEMKVKLNSFYLRWTHF